MVKTRFFFFLISRLAGVGVMFFFCSCAALPPGGASRQDFYIDLNSYPLYAKNGFNPADIAALPDMTDGSWVAKQPGESRGIASVESLGLPDMPRRAFLSPFKEKDREYTLLIPFVLEPEQFEKIHGEKPFQPGIFLAALGDNWEIFLNGRLAQSEIHLDGEGQIRSGRGWRHIVFPLDRSGFVPGTNVLAFRIVGAPHCAVTGLWHEDPYYIGDYGIIRTGHDESLILALSAVYLFVGLYHFLLFLYRPQYRYNLYYSLFSVLMGLYFLMRSGPIHNIIPNSNITLRLEYASLYALISMLAFFLDHLNFEKITVFSKASGSLSMLCVIAQGILPNSFGDDLLYVSWVIALCQIVYILGYDIAYGFCRNFKTLRRPPDQGFLKLLWAALAGTSLGNMLIGAVIICGVAGYDIIHSIYLRCGVVNVSQAGLFIFTLAVIFIIARRFGTLFREIDEANILLEKTNLNLDSTVQKRTRELELQTEVAQSASRAKSDFLARMSHEIRTPLNAILGLSEVELQKGLPGETRRNLEKIHHSGSHLLEIVNDLLDISKIESGNFDITPAEYEVCGLINDVIQINIARIGIKPIVFKLEIDETIPSKLCGDELRIKQIFNNILSNAFKYTEEGMVRFAVHWERKETQALLSFVVEDTGKGMKKEDLTKLFSEYTQFETVANRRIEGTGLGLAITRGLVERMAGTITTESEYLKGSVFRIVLPQRIVDEKPIGREMVENLCAFRFIEDRSRSRGSNLIRSYMPYGKALVVDDLQTNLDVMTGLLMPYGIKVDTVLSGREAVESIRAQMVRYDLVFMDHMMPEMDGIEAVRTIRNEIESEYALTVPIIALTANAVAENRELFLNSGFTDFITKPVDIKQLDMILNRWIRDKQGETALRDAMAQNPEWLDAGLNQDPSDPEGRWLLQRPVEGIDFAAALMLYGNSIPAYMPILQSFVTHTPALLAKMDACLETLSPDYSIEAHGLKGTCNAVGAGGIAAIARELELASKAKNFDFVRQRHGTLRKQTLELTERLRALLEEWEAALPGEEKERRDEPDRELLARLSAAASEFNSNAVEEILGELERYRYEQAQGQELIVWLREQAENFDYAAIHTRLSEFPGAK
jgi:signal transduction histidine kinase/CheY-like chemotaxis protein